MSEPTKQTIGWMVSEIYAAIKRVEGKLDKAQEDKVEYSGLEAEMALQGKFPGANLGLASTEEMMRELIARMKHVSEANINVNIERALVLSEMLGSMGAPEREYRTVTDG